ncbi:branched-chain amino acid ABC transporter permease [Clostridia bacterium]|nr:branched-chain amino acid ABC transporter permease [Clostridia bacterium]
MELFLQQLVNGISLGSIYALIALGYTMVYGIIKLINFAHGDVYMLGAYIGYALTTYAGFSFFPAILIAMVSCGILGICIERVAYKPLRNSPRITLLITAIGVSLLLEYVLMYFVGARVRAYPNPPIIPNDVIHLGENTNLPINVVINTQQLVIIATTIILMVILQFIVMKTKRGKAMRAVSTDMDAAQLMGIDVDQTISFTFLLGAALAGAAGVLVGVYYGSINPLMGIMPGLKAFIAAVFGGIGSIPGAMIGGYAIGIIETFVMGYGNSLYRDAAVFVILILILIIKPTGLLGKNTREKV